MQGIHKAKISARSFRDFVSTVNPRYRWYKHCEALADVLQRVADGKIKRLMVFEPPRHGKSETVSRLFSAYFLYRYPERWVGLSSYAADLAYTLSRNARDNYRLAGGTIKGDAGAVVHWETGKGGGLWAAGAGGPATGKGGHCFPAGTMIETEQGLISIDTLFRLQDRPKALSFNHEKQVVEYRSILAAASRPGKPLVEIVLHSGRRIHCTADHPIYCLERGYRQAATLIPGETVIQIPTVQELPDMRDGDRQECDLQRVPYQSERDSLPASLRPLWRGIHAAAIRGGKGVFNGLCGFLLRRDLQPGSSRRQESSKMQSLWRSCGQIAAEVLRDLQAVAFGALAATLGYCLRFLRRVVSPTQLPHNLLQQRLQPLRSFAADARERQQSLQNRNQLRRLVPKDASCYSRKGWACLRSLWGEECSASDATAAKKWSTPREVAAADSPYRPSATKQQSGKLSDALWEVSRHASQTNRCWQTDTVSSVVFLRETPERVYDLQVEGNCNFFADGVLAHNCLIVDDPIKNAEEAASPVIRAKIQDWWNSTWYTREEPWSDDDPHGAIIVVQTRWHEDDLSGWLLEQERQAEDEEDRERWHIVNLPAIAEEPIEFPATCTVEPDWRQPGEALCPERRPIEKLQKIRRRITEYYFDALFQQRPSVKEGEFFKMDKLEIVEALPAGLRLCRAWDLAASKKTSSAFTCGSLLGVDGAGVYYVCDVKRGQWAADQVRSEMRNTSVMDGQSVSIHLPQDPGQAGKDQAEQMIRLLAGFNVKSEPVTGSKEIRAFNFSAQWNAGNVKLLRAAWNKAFIEEHRQFPRGKLKDQVDSASDAFNELATGGDFEQFDWIR